MFQETQNVPARIFSFEFARFYVVTMRPYLLFVSGITGIVGLSFAPSLSILNWAILSLAFFLCYGFGQALTDCFQTDTDSISSPYRPLTQGKLRRRDVLLVSLTGLLLIGIILTICSPINLALSSIATLGLATYTFFKRRWWGGPFYNAWIVALLCLIAYIAGTGLGQADLIFNLPLLTTIGSVFFGYANFVLTGYYKDVSADRATGYNTLLVVFGFKGSAIVSDVFAVLAITGCWAAVYLTLSADGSSAVIYPACLFSFAGLGASAIAQVRLHGVQSEKEAHSAIAPVVHAYILLLSGIAAAQKPNWGPALLFVYLGFVVTVKLRPMKQQI